jgi:hypothetical protein
MTKVESFFAISKFVEAIDEQVCTIIHERFVVNKRAHGIQVGEPLSSLALNIVSEYIERCKMIGFGITMSLDITIRK